MKLIARRFDCMLVRLARGYLWRRGYMEPDQVFAYADIERALSSDVKPLFETGILSRLKKLPDRIFIWCIGRYLARVRQPVHLVNLTDELHRTIEQALLVRTDRELRALDQQQMALEQLDPNRPKETKCSSIGKASWLNPPPS